MNINVSKFFWNGSFISLFLTLAIANAAYGEEFYKVIDKNGNVSYSSVQPDSGKSAEVIPVFPSPSEEAILSAQQQLQEAIEERKKEEVSAQDVSAQAVIQAIDKKEEVKKAPPVRGFNPFIALAPFL